MTDTAELRKLAEAATPGPWAAEANLPFGEKPRVQTDEQLICEVGNMGTSQDEWEANAAYIAAACPDRLIALLDEVDASMQKMASQLFLRLSTHQRATLSHLADDGALLARDVSYQVRGALDVLVDCSFAHVEGFINSSPGQVNFITFVLTDLGRAALLTERASK